MHGVGRCMRVIPSCKIALILVLVASLFAQQPRLQITTQSLPNGLVNEQYRTQLAATGGSAPYVWRIVQAEGSLPPGLRLDENGLLSGVPTTAGVYRFTVEARDSNPQPVTARRRLSITVSTGLTIRWSKVPTVEGEAIAGEVVVSNSTGDNVDLTVIILAVNEVNKAFALGYQHFTLQARAKSQVIPFGASLPFGSYIIHADAIGEVPAKRRIFRTRLQTPAPLIVEQR